MHSSFLHEKFGSSCSQDTSPSSDKSIFYWFLIKDKLRELLDSSSFSNWIEPLKVKDVSDKEFIILMPNLVFHQRFISDFWDHIENCKILLGLESISIRLEMDNLSDTSTPVSNIPVSFFDNSSSSSSIPTADQIPDVSSFSSSKKSVSSKCHLISNYTFDSFVRGPSNQFALATCLSVADNPGKSYNPLFIYGGSGLGKTHLLHAVGNRLSQINPSAVVTYISSERFTNEMIYCIRFNKMWDFRQKYRLCDCFLVDDIQFISGKIATQEEFFHTFNALYEAKKQIVITSDMFPQDIPDIEDRLRNRFQWGLIADIQPPDVEHRIAILLSKADNLNISLSEDVAEYIASHAKKNVRELEGALHRIAAFSALQGRPIDKDLAIETFQNVLGEPPKNLRIELIQKVVSDHFKIKLIDLKSKRRHRALTLPRQIAMYLCRSLTKSSFPEIGEKFGGKDHTTVIHAVKKIELVKSKDFDLKAHIESIERQIEQLS